MATYLLKTEPSTFSFADLVARGASGTRWDGVTNAQALIALRAMAKGDAALIYHTGDQKAIVGVATVLSDPYPDPAKPPDRTPSGQPKWAVVDIAAADTTAAVRRTGRAAPSQAAQPKRAPAAGADSRFTPVPLAALRKDPRFSGFQLLTHSRLSVMPVAPAHAKALIDMLLGT